jgi:hypothetical protein
MKCTESEILERLPDAAAVRERIGVLTRERNYLKILLPVLEKFERTENYLRSSSVPDEVKCVSRTT